MSLQEKMGNSEQLFRNRIIELTELSELQNRYIYTDFLALQELDSFYKIMKETGNNNYSVWGGADFCERRMVCFGTEKYMGYASVFPITGILVEPSSIKFASELKHRDFLGSLLNLGIERSVIGDILVKDKAAYVFVQENMSDYIVANMERVGRTPVKVSVQNKELDDKWKPVLQETEVPVVSLRIDVVLAAVYKLSRSQSQSLFREKKVYVNGRNMENHSYLLKEEALISVRGFGRFLFVETVGTSKKNKLYIKIKKYI